MDSERECRLEAARCLLEADAERDPARRIQLTRTAAAWLDVAVQTAINAQAKAAVSSTLGDLRAPRETRALWTIRGAPIVRAER
jgi:hypothetical protein